MQTERSRVTGQEFPGLHMTRTLPFCCVLMLAAAVASAQVPFEVASVKPTLAKGDEALGASFSVQPGGRLVATSATLRDLVAYAYDSQWFQIEGGPDWAADAKFDISARSQNLDATQRELRSMLRSLLVTRFKLQAKPETRALPVYELIVATGNGRLGPGLRRANVDCTDVLDARAVLDLSRVAPEREACQPEGRFIAGPTTSMELVRKGVTMQVLARMLTALARRTVIDRTGLTGAYDFELTYSPENVIYVVQGGPIQTAGSPGDGLSIFTAVREQLGLRLTSARGPGEVLVIESAMRPEPD